MILKHIEVTNFQKYKRLVLAGLPARGVVGIVGGNESGKSTIGEAISFALFGKTLRTDDSNIRDVIHWHEDSAIVKLGFSLGARGEYEVTRELDREGSYFAQLVDLSTGKVVAKGIGKVQKRLDALIELSFAEFRYSFYLGQNEIDVLQAVEGAGKRRALDQMTGIANIEHAADHVQKELSVHRADLERIKLEAEHTHTRLSEYEGVAEGEQPVSTRIREIDDKIERLRSQERDLNRQRDDLARRRGARGRAIAAIEALRVRTYAEVLGRLRDRTNTAVGDLARQEEAAARELAEAHAKDERRRELLGRLDELERLVYLHLDEIQIHLRNKLEATFNEESADLLTPETKAEQLAVTEKRIAAATTRITQSRSSGRALMALSWTFLAIALLAHLAWPRPQRASTIPVFALAGISTFLFLGARRHRGEVTAHQTRRQTLERIRASLEEEVARKRRALDACTSFRKHELAQIPEKVRWMDSDRILAFLERIRSEHPQAWTSPPSVMGATADTAVALIDRKRQALDNVRRQRHEMDEFLSWLRVTTTGLAASQHYVGDLGEGYADEEKGAYRTAAAPPLSYEAFRRGKEIAADIVQDCARSLFTLEGASDVPTSGQEVGALVEALGVVLGDGNPEVATSRTQAEAILSMGPDAADERVVATRKCAQAVLSIVPTVAALDEEQARLHARAQAQALALADALVEKQESAAELRKLAPDVERQKSLKESLEEFNRKAAEASRRIRVREALLEMLKELEDHLRQRLGPSLAEFVSWVLPQITSNRYHEVRLSPDLDIEVFSRERGGYVNLASLSGGTVDQLLLAVRMAFSKALVYSKWNPQYQQCLFFDEPLASFDESRGDAFLAMLNKRDANFAQVFLTSQHASIERHCDRVIRTELRAAELVET